MTNEKTSTWAGFGSEYLKAIDVLNDTDEYAIVDVDSKVENGKDVLHLHLSRDGFTKLFGCNQTNKQAVQEAFPENPNACVGAVITFNKVKVAVPNTEPAEIVDGLRLQFKPRTESIPETTISEEKPELVEQSTSDSGVAEDGSM